VHEVTRTLINGLIPTLSRAAASGLNVITRMYYDFRHHAEAVLRQQIEPQVQRTAHTG
jgi:hypothetical protein